jgi:molybdate transport system substrate-binding protein
MSIRLATAAIVMASLAPPGAGPPLTVSAAISLSDALEEAAAAYVKAGGGPVRFNFAGSNVLARQIVNGAPVDVFISADEAQMLVVERAGAVAPGSRRVLVSNQLAVVALPERLAQVRDEFRRAAPGIRRLAIGDPAAVPAGVYARRYLERRGLWAAYESRVVPTGNVRGALSAVANGSADAAIVYATDVNASGSVKAAVLIPLDDAPPIAYPAAVIAASRNGAAAERFLAFLQSGSAGAIFARYGFLPPPGQGGR